jgi:N-methylhydantoinase B/oxoprolinase/acetone carboxylase alpha subunit
VGIFDDIDKQFHPKEPIKLECQGDGCNKSGDGVERRANMFIPTVSEVLCERCWMIWAPWGKSAF